MEIDQLTESDSARLAEFVAQHPHGSIEQTWEWGALQSSIPGRDSFFVMAVKSDTRILGSMMLIRQTMGYGKTWLWCPGGPLLPEKEGNEAWELLLDAVKEVAGTYGDVFLRMEPFSPVDSGPELGAPSKESYLPRHTLTLDLTLSTDELLAQMAQKGRYNIKQAHKAGVYVRLGDAMEMEDFYEILKETAARDGFSLHSKEFYDAFLDSLGANARFYLAYHEQDLLGGILATHFGDTATYYFGASSNVVREKMAPYALQWFAIQEAKNLGLKRYDFLGIAPEDEEGHPLKGVTQFKTRFGGNRVAYQSAQVVVFRPTWHRIYRLVKTLRRLFSF